MMDRMAGTQETRFTRAGDIDIAYQVVGPDQGRDLIFVPSWVSNIEVMWELPEFAAFLERLASFGRLVVFDKRGTGLSDRILGTPTLEERADDIRAVMAAAGSTQAAILGWGDGGAIAAMFAATYPGRVTALVLGSLAVKLNPEMGAPMTADPATMQAMSDAVESGWGTGDFVAAVAPSRANDERLRTWYGKWQRRSATPNAAAALLRWATEIDVGSVLPAVQAPTLVLARSHDLFDKDAVRAAANLIPNGRYLELPGADALPFIGDSDGLLDEVQEFLTGTRGSPDLDRSLATVCFTDIIDSTRKAEQLGDRRWRYLLESHNAQVRQLLDRAGGVEIDTAGDGFFSTFDGPARAIRFACAARDAVGELGLQIRAGLHTGEVERRQGKVTGVAVHVGARVAALARESEVLVTGAVKMLVLGSGINFADRGTHSIKGIQDLWQIFAVES